MRTRIFAAVWLPWRWVPGCRHKRMTRSDRSTRPPRPKARWSIGRVTTSRTNRGIADKFSERYPGNRRRAVQDRARARHWSASPRNRRRDGILSMSSTPRFPTCRRCSTGGWSSPIPGTRSSACRRKACSSGGRALRFFELDTPIAYNSTMAAAGDFKSWDSLLDEKWRGKLLLEVRGLPFPILAEAWGEDRTFTFLKKLLTLDPVIIRGATPEMEALGGRAGRHRHRQLYRTRAGV